jgi:hypothetical protein
MDDKTARRIDSLYRNINSFLLLAILSLFIPIFLLFVVPLSLAYLYLRAKLLAEIDSRQIILDDAPPLRAGRSSELTTTQKVDFIRRNTARLWAPSIILIGVAMIGVVIVLAMP